MNKFNIGKDFQQHNFKEILHKMADVSGWEMIDTMSLLALKAPVSTNFINFVYGDTSLSNRLLA